MEASWAIDDITGEFGECSEWVPDRSPANETHRRLFAAMLAEVLIQVRTHDIRSWEHSEWELRAAYAAADWDRARTIFENARLWKLVPGDRLAILRLQFELLAIIGPHLDVLLTHDERSPSAQLLKRLSESYGVFDHRFSPDNLEIGSEVLEWASDERGQGWKNFLLLLPLLDTPLPIVPGDAAWDIRVAIKTAASDLCNLIDGGVFLRALAGYALEAMGEMREAISQYESLLGHGSPFEGRRGEFLKCKIAEMLKDLGDIAASRQQLKTVNVNADLRPPAERLLGLAVNLGELEIARSIADNLTDDEKRGLAEEPLFHLLLEPKSDALLKELPAVQEQCAKWKPYAKLSIEAQNAWCSATVHQRSSEHVAEIKSAWERNSVVDYTIAVEIEMRRLFQAFKSVNAKSIDIWKVDSMLTTGYPLFAKWLMGRHQLTSREMAKIIRQSAEGAVQPAAAQQLRAFLSKRHQAVLTPRVLHEMERLYMARNAGVHEGTTEMKPREASRLATGILEAIHPA